MVLSSTIVALMPRSVYADFILEVMAKFAKVGPLGYLTFDQYYADI